MYNNQFAQLLQIEHVALTSLYEPVPRQKNPCILSSLRTLALGGLGVGPSTPLFLAICMAPTLHRGGISCTDAAPTPSRWHIPLLHSGGIALRALSHSLEPTAPFLPVLSSPVKRVPALEFSAGRSSGPEAYSIAPCSLPVLPNMSIPAASQLLRKRG